MPRGISRRRFLQLGGTTLAGLSLSPVLARSLQAAGRVPAEALGLASRPLPKELLEKVLTAALSRGGDFADLFLEHSVESTVQLSEGKIQGLGYSVRSGAGIRVVDGTRRGFAHSELLDEKSLLDAARTAAVIARSGTGVPPRGLRPRRVQRHTTFAIPIERGEEGVKIALLHRAEESARGADPRVRDVGASWKDQRRYIQVANSQGFMVEDTLSMVVLRAKAMARELGDSGSGQARFSERAGWEVADRIDAEALGQEAARIALLGLGAREAPAGPVMTVIGNQGGILFHEAVGHGLEADSIRKGTSCYAGRLGQEVASPEVTLIDDATIPGLRGSFNIDDEGVPGQRKVLIRDGILKDYLYDQFEALPRHRLSSGSGRRDGYSEMPQPRMSNTFLKAGRVSPEDIIRSVGRGFYAAGFGGGMVDTASGQFTFSVTEGYLIEDGKITHPVRNAALVGSGSEVLQNIDLVGNDLEFWPGSCGKGGQWVPVTAGCPTLRVRSIVVGGRG